MIGMMRIAFVASALALPAGAFAQQTTAPPPQHPLQVERIESGFVIAPDARFTKVNDRTATLAGGYGGWLMDQTLLIGAGGYWLVNDARDFKMAYGGAVVEWFVRGNRQAGISTRALVGGGRATLSNTFGELLGARATSMNEVVRFGRDHGMGRYDRSGLDPLTVPTTRVIYTDDFFVAEPQINGFIKVTDWLRFNAGVGYRLIGGTSNPNVDDRLRGLSGSVAIVFGGG
jgi:hypothetical protein